MQLTRVPDSLRVIVYFVLRFQLFHHELFPRILRHILSGVYFVSNNALCYGFNTL